jgi:hypothetical protein
VRRRRSWSQARWASGCIRLFFLLEGAGKGFGEQDRRVVRGELGWKLEYFSFLQRMGFIRNTLRFKLPGEQYRCDLVIGVPAAYDQVFRRAPTTASTYVLVYPQGGKLEGVPGSVQDS